LGEGLSMLLPHLPMMTLLCVVVLTESTFSRLGSCCVVFSIYKYCSCLFNDKLFTAQVVYVRSRSWCEDM